MTIDFAKYRKKVAGCYTGKAVGGTLGMPFEGDLGTRDISYYEPVPTGVVANDDLDLQVINLELIRRFGLPVDRYHLSKLWWNMQDMGPDEYGVARWNVQLGRNAPLSGFYANKFHGGMGAAIRSELWACLAPGDPALAARLAYEDACTDHYDDGIHACMFLAALESAGFVQDDTECLIAAGLSVLPDSCVLKTGIQDAVGYWKSTRNIYAARELVLQNHFSQNWTDVTINLSFIVIAWLASGGDFGKGICCAADLGYDADCTCATLGSIMGIIDPASISEEWIKPIGSDLVLGCGICGIHEPKTVDEFCDLVADTAVSVLAYYKSPVRFGGTDSSSVVLRKWTEKNDIFSEQDDPHISVIAVQPLTVKLKYPLQVSLKPNSTNEFELELVNPCDEAISGSCTFVVPENWCVTPADIKISCKPFGHVSYRLSVTTPSLDKRRPQKNYLDLHFYTNGLHWSTEAGLALTIPWIRENLDTGIIEIIEAYAPFQDVPAGRFVYHTAFKLNTNVDMIMSAQSTRKLCACLNGQQVLTGDGSMYVPAFHRGSPTAKVTSSADNSGWNYVDITVDDGVPGELFVGFSRRHSCGEWLIGVEYSIMPLMHMLSADPKCKTK